MHRQMLRMWKCSRSTSWKQVGCCKYCTSQIWLSSKFLSVFIVPFFPAHGRIVLAAVMFIVHGSVCLWSAGPGFCNRRNILCFVCVSLTDRLFCLCMEDQLVQLAWLTALFGCARYMWTHYTCAYTLVDMHTPMRPLKSILVVGCWWVLPDEKNIHYQHFCFARLLSSDFP